MISRDRPVFVMELSPYVLEERGASLDELMQYLGHLAIGSTAKGTISRCCEKLSNSQRSLVTERE